jgi:DNA polymerase-1
MTTVLIDSDIVAYRCAASCEKQGVVVEDSWVCLRRVDELMQRIIAYTGASDWKAFLTGSDNYRNAYNPEYKANRKDTRRPQWLQQAREHLVTHWQASVEDGQEADDALGIYQCSHENTIIASIDKDLLCIPGKHYNFITGTFHEQSIADAFRHFYFQLIMGDRADNIFGFDGLARASVPKKLEATIAELDSYDNEHGMFEFVRALYSDDERLLMNGRCLYIRQKEGQVWNFPK